MTDTGMTDNRVSYLGGPRDPLLPEATVPSPQTSRRNYRAYGIRREQPTVEGPTRRPVRTASVQSDRFYTIDLNEDGPSLSVADARAPAKKGRIARWMEKLAALWARSVGGGTATEARNDRIQRFKAGLEASLVGLIAEGLGDGTPNVTWRRNVTHYLDLIDGEEARGALDGQSSSPPGYKLSDQDVDEIAENVANRVLVDLDPAEVIDPDSLPLENLRKVIRTSGEPRLKSALFAPLVYWTQDKAILVDPSERIQLVKPGLASVLTDLAAQGLKGDADAVDLMSPVTHYQRMLEEKQPSTTLSDHDVRWLAETVADRLAQDIEPDREIIDRLNGFFAESGHELLTETFSPHLSRCLEAIMNERGAAPDLPE